MVRFGLDYACAHMIILAEISSENLLPIRADFVTERDKGKKHLVYYRVGVRYWECPLKEVLLYITSNISVLHSVLHHVLHHAGAYIARISGRGC